jgi:hypothetical protein
MRTSDAERQRAADFLRDACGDGRLSPNELEERLDALFRGTTVADIAVLVRDLPGGRAVIPRLDDRGGSRRPTLPSPLPVRRRTSPAVPVGFALLVVGLGGLVFAALPPLLAIVFAAVALSIAIAFGVMAIALAPVGLALFGLAWLVNRVFRGGMGPRGWAGPRRGRHPFL